ncbi:hypothetical protein GOHSU_12_00260 [Gordonia hirsuta DSM 44140 = NBRC 16056]|uniref:Uncharacterized protein n=1 Tax=Gordonia hirsuta DSM 44140 = NBRC 16056 TaxID=1121927 RepID=L7L7B4_9ACTN|nr:hypothetical protein [Gordonia hirsuta]GAC56636.1 hypothetical protein GOHSU_12_00260 [Gordonia hirsuta DSM 44140 = NBRC 16056]
MASEPMTPAGSEAIRVQLSPCVGGLVRTWYHDGGQTHLWSSPDADWLTGALATGRIGRTHRAHPRDDAEDQRHFREVGLLSTESGTLVVHGPDETVLRLEPVDQPHDDSVAGDFHDVLTQAVEHCVATGEYLIVEQGDPTAPGEPFCLFTVIDGEDGPICVIDTAPDPHGSQLWEPHLIAGRPTQELSASATPEALSVAPTLMIDAISRWGLEPWDLAFTFGTP